MRHLITTAALAPVLLLQGRHVRRVTPVLPEPPGPREGRAGQGPVLRLLILGDSAAAGVGAATQDEALSGQLVARLAHRHTLHWRLLARTGDTTADALRALDALAGARFDVVVTSLGVNDVTAGRPLHRWVADQEALVHRLAHGLGARHVLLSAVPPMHRFPALPEPLRGWLGTRAHRCNAALQALAARHPVCSCVALDFDAPGLSAPPATLMALDGFHPGPPLYRAWAAQLDAALAARLPSP